MISDFANNFQRFTIVDLVTAFIDVNSFNFARRQTRRATGFAELLHQRTAHNHEFCTPEWNPFAKCNMQSIAAQEVSTPARK